MPSWGRWFVWLPLGHSEEEAAEAPPHLKAMYEFGVSQARAARNAIARFGRHPHRNEVLGRTSTPEEPEYLRTETPPHLRQPPSWVFIQPGSTAELQRV
jgi:uncharacterized protein (DUF924 family)